MDKSVTKRFDPVAASVGEIGRWQIFVILAICCVKFPLACQISEIIFIAPPVNFECAILDNGTDRCSPSCLSHTFDRSVFTNTIIMEWDLVCDKAQYANIAQMVVILGMLFGANLFGYCTDRFGRQKSTTVAVTIHAMTSICMTFITNFWFFVFIRFVSAITLAGMMLSTMVWIVEFVGINWRSTVHSLFQTFYIISYLLLILLAYFFRDWRHLHLIISIPSFLLIGFVFLPESPRWLIATGKLEAAVAVLENGARINGLPTEKIRSFVYQGSSLKDGEKSHKGNVLMIFKSSELIKKFVCITIMWILTSFCGFGTPQYMGEIAGSIFINTMVGALVQFPGLMIAVVSLRFFGRKLCLITNLVVAAMAYFGIIFVSGQSAWITTTLAATGSCFVFSSLSIFFLFAGELFPTVVRNVTLGLIASIGRSGGLASPFVATLRENYAYLPPMIFGSALILSALITLILPETRGSQLPDTIHQEKNKKDCVYKKINTEIK